MGASDSESHHKKDVSDTEELKYLGFIQVAVLHAILCLSYIYTYAKDNSGPLKHGVESVEGAVKTVVSPVYHKFNYFPIELLRFVDRKMDASMTNLDNRIPPVVKQVSTQAFSAAQKAPEVARGVISEVRRDGVVGAAKNACVNPVAKVLYSKYEPAAKELYSKYEPAAKELYSKYEPAAKEIYSKYEPAAKELYTKYEPVAERYAVLAWLKLNQLPLFSQVAEVIVPTAAYYSEKYNQAVLSNAGNGVRVAGYLPLVPTEKIAKVFSAEVHETITEIPVS